MTRYSIIIPHYNSPDSLDKLLTSIGIHDDVQIIVVDDKSNKHLSEYAEVKKKHERTCSFFDNTTPQKGAGVCRNIGLDNATGIWLLFADSDDYFIGGWYSNVCNYCNSNADVVIFPPISEIEGKIGTRHEKYLRLVNEFNENKPNSDLHLRIQFFPPWSKMIRKSLVVEKKVHFDETMYSNDVMFSTKVGFYAKSIDAANEPIYCVVDKAGTLTKNRSFDAFYIRNSVICNVYNFLKTELSDEQFKDAYIRNTPILNLYIAFKAGYGLKGVRKLIRLYKANGVSILSPSAFNIKRIVHYLKK